ncbi:F-box/kelch-repeat protein At1g24800, partial [Brassica rapa]|uniref:F-box/kelch-repeat protein At1g24800 n=1 Tax=Brassica campestris TaxID=3711 RepID=UPI00142DF1FF
SPNDFSSSSICLKPYVPVCSKNLTRLLFVFLIFQFEATLKKPKNLGKAESKECLKTRANLKKRKKHVLNVGRVTRFSDLPLDLVGDKILSKLPITSLGAVRSTCKLWNALSREWILSNAAKLKRQVLGFMTMDYKIYSLRFHLHKDKYRGVYQSRKHIDILNQVEISKVFHCHGLLLCVLKDKSRLVVWNPYLGQTRWIEPRTNFHKCDRYAFGYDKNRNHKILRCFDDYDIINKKLSFMVEIYDLRSHSWKVLDVTSDLAIEYDANGASLKGNTYFFVQEEIPPGDGSIVVSDLEDFLICFDFTNERFGQRLPLPFHSSLQEAVTLSCVGEDQLAVLYERLYTIGTLEFWVTTKIEPNAVTWSKFLNVDMTPHDGYLSHVGSFIIDEEEKAAMVFDGRRDDQPSKTRRYHRAMTVGDGYCGLYEGLRKCPTETRPPLVCSSSYLPSLVQIN